jgi:hypothetical protein
VSAGTSGGLKKELGRVGGRRGRGSRRRERVRARWSTAGVGTVELTGEAHSAEREKGRAGQRLSAWQNGPARQRGKRGARRGKQLAPTSWPHWAERERGARGGRNCRRQVVPTYQAARARGRATWLGRVGPAGLLCLFLFLWIF